MKVTIVSPLKEESLSQPSAARDAAAPTARVPDGEDLLFPVDDLGEDAIETSGTTSGDDSVRGEDFARSARRADSAPEVGRFESRGWHDTVRRAAKGLPPRRDSEPNFVGVAPRGSSRSQAALWSAIRVNPFCTAPIGRFTPYAESLADEPATKRTEEFMQLAELTNRFPRGSGSAGPDDRTTFDRRMQRIKTLRATLPEKDDVALDEASKAFVGAFERLAHSSRNPAADDTHEAHRTFHQTGLWLQAQASKFTTDRILALVGRPEYLRTAVKEVVELHALDAFYQQLRMDRKTPVPADKPDSPG